MRSFPLSEGSQPTGQPGEPTGPLEASQHPLRAAFLWGQIGRVLEIAANIAYSILVIRLLTPGDYGLYSIIWSIVNTTILLISLGTEEAIARYTQSILLRQSHLLGWFQRRFLVERLLIGVAAGITIFFGASLLGDWMKSPQLFETRWLLAALIAFISIWNLFSAIFVATLRMRDYAFIRFVNQLLNLALAAAGFYWLGIKAEVALGSMVVSFALGNLFFFLFLFKSQRQTRVVVPEAGPGKLDTRPIRRYGLSLWLTNLATYGLASQIDVLLIAGLLGSQEMVSFYNVPLVLLLKVTTVITGWQAIMIPATTRVFELHGLPGLRNQFSLFMRINIMFLLPVFAFIITHASLVITLVFGEAYRPAAPFLILMTGFSILSIMSAANIAQPFLYVLNRQNSILSLRISAGILNFILDLLFIPMFGVMGAILGTGISNLLTHLSELILLLRRHAAEMPWLFITKAVACSTLAILPTLLIPGDGWVDLITSGVLFGFLFIGIAMAMRLVQEEELDIISQAVPQIGIFRAKIGWHKKR